MHFLANDNLKNVVIEGSEMRIWPVMMTSTSIIFGLLPAMYVTGTGSEVMSRIAAPMV
jgi:Cu(I)/Ag(I) efflux system membrane protein CusA/SilA